MSIEERTGREGGGLEEEEEEGQDYEKERQRPATPKIREY